MSDDKNKYRLDKTAFQAMTFEEADNHYGYWKGRSLKERWDAGCYLSMQMYGCDKNTPLDKTVFNKRKHKNG
ncbi:MAG TPA: hypothetical protein VK787_07150 [Puia sp.]|jgi:hypothetical protein|nr:hypothetical protein [Puia sp.]